MNNVNERVQVNDNIYSYNYSKLYRRMHVYTWDLHN